MPISERWWHKLTQAEALALRMHYRNGHSMARLARDFEVSRTTVGLIIRGQVRPVLGLPNISRGRGRPRRVDTLPR